MSSDAFKEHLAQLQAEYRAALPGRLADLDARWEAALRAPADAASFAASFAASLTELHRLLHSLAGSAKTFGLAPVGAAAREAEHFIEPFCSAQPRTLSSRERERFGELLAVLRQSARAGG